jgi:hypothetical protein
MTKHKLHYENSWEADEYSVDGKRVTELKRVQIGDIEYKVTKCRIAVPYYDMGHQYNGVSDHFFVEETVFGIKMKFDLNKIINKKPVYALEFETE